VNYLDWSELHREICWKLRYRPDALTPQEQKVGASAISALLYLTNPTIPMVHAVNALRRLRSEYVEEHPPEGLVMQGRQRYHVEAHSEPQRAEDCERCIDMYRQGFHDERHESGHPLPMRWQDCQRCADLDEVLS
jgi:NAD-dependent dihydropyrimidine dehydrogenase PreA subunit